MKYALIPVMAAVDEFVESRKFTGDEHVAEWVGATTYVDGAKALRLIYALYQANHGKDTEEGQKRELEVINGS